MLHRLNIVVIVPLLFLAGCATMTPAARLRNEIFWEAAKECEFRYHTLHLEQIDLDGHVTLRADAESQSEIRPFTECYRQAVRARIEGRRQAGLPIPDELNREPTAEID